MTDSSLSPAPVQGLDNAAPLYNPNGRWQIWNMDEIYLGQNGQGKYVPKVKDLIYEIAGRQVSPWIVQSIDPVTYVPVLVAQDFSNITNTFNETDYLLGVGPSTQSDTYRVYIDKSVSPYRLNVDRRCYIGTADYCKIFKGSNLSNDGIVISGIFDEFNVLQTENIPCVLVATNTLTNNAIKVVGDGYTIFDLPDGEVVVAVFYSSNGAVISKRQLLVENTGFVRQTDANKKYVSSIELDTPFLSTINSNVIEYPINVPLTSANLVGVVNYSDGSRVLLPIDGNKFSLFGLENYTPTILGQSSDSNGLVLKYRLDNGEEALDVHVGTDKFISKIYQIKTIASNGQYSVKLFAYPMWVNDATGYTLKWFMYDLDRVSSYDVTANVIINSNVSSYNPKLYGTKQTLSVSINLRSVNGSYNDFNHVQILDVTLNKPGTGRPNVDSIPNWLVKSVSSESNVFGNNVYSTYKQVSLTEYTIRVGAGFTNLPDWLNGLYILTSPLYDNNVEIAPLTPTHFIIVINGVEFVNPISSWNSQILVNQTVVNNSTIIIKFIRRLANNDLELSVAATPTYLINDLGVFL